MREKELPGTDGTIPVNDADSEGGAGSFPAEGIVIDPNLGISEEEQREILAEINRITVKNRLSLDGEKPETNKAGKKGAGDSGFRAKKKDSLFPVLVNAAAVALLAGGFFLLSSFQGKEDVKIRESDRIYNIAEQALIEEIRRETASLLEAKESEIAVMTSKLAGVDGELQELQDSVEVMMRAKEAELRKEMSEAFSAERQRLVDQNLSEAAIIERMRQFDAERIAGMNTQLTNYRQQLDAERADSESTLKNLQEEYRSSLASLQNERSQLLESSRASEAALRTQLEAKTRELAAMTEQARSSLNDARSELERLSSDQEKAAVIESQLGGYYIMVNDLIEKGLLTEAADILEVMREYLNTPAFQSIRSIQARRPLYAASIDLLEGVIHDLAASKVTAAPAPAPKGEEEQIIADLWRKNAELEESLENLNKAAAAAADMETGLKTQTTDLERRLAAAASAESTLRARSTALEQQTAERERAIAALQAQNNSLTQTVAARDNTISTLQSQNNNLTQTVAARNNTISTLQSQNSSLTQTVAARDNTISTLQSQNGSLTQTVAARDNTISELRSRTTSLEETIQSLNSQLTTIRAALQALSQ
jgi:chromosome segregation ATPase